MLRCLCCCGCCEFALTLEFAFALENPLERKPPRFFEPVSRNEWSASEGNDDKKLEPSSPGEKGGDATSWTADRADEEDGDDADGSESNGKRGTTVGDSGDMSFDGAASAVDAEEETARVDAGVVKSEASVLARPLAPPLASIPTALVAPRIEVGATEAAAEEEEEEEDDDEDEAEEVMGARTVAVVVCAPCSSSSSGKY